MHMKTCFVDGNGVEWKQYQKMGMTIMFFGSFGRRHLENYVIAKSR